MIGASVSGTHYYFVNGIPKHENTPGDGYGAESDIYKRK